MVVGLKVLPTVGNLGGPRLCTQHFREEDIIKTRVGIRLKSNVIPMLGVQSQKVDFSDDIEVISGDGNSFKFNQAHLAAMCPALRQIIASCKEETPNLIFDDVDTETVQSFYYYYYYYISNSAIISYYQGQ